MWDENYLTDLWYIQNYCKKKYIPSQESDAEHRFRCAGNFDVIVNRMIRRGCINNDDNLVNQIFVDWPLHIGVIRDTRDEKRRKQTPDVRCQRREEGHLLTGKAALRKESLGTGETHHLYDKREGKSIDDCFKYNWSENKGKIRKIKWGDYIEEVRDDEHSK